MVNNTFTWIRWRSILIQSLDLLLLTMKLCGNIGGHEVVVLIDCGASHNFISRKVVQRLGLIVCGNKSVGVMMGNGSLTEVRVSVEE